MQDYLVELDLRYEEPTWDTTERVLVKGVNVEDAKTKALLLTTRNQLFDDGVEPREITIYGVFPLRPRDKWDRDYRAETGEDSELFPLSELIYA